MGDMSSGMNYAPKGKPAPVVKPGEFIISAIGLDHGHIYGQCGGLMEAGAVLKSVYDPDPRKVENFCKAFPQAIPAKSEEEVLSDPEVHLVTGAAITSERCALGLRVMNAGKDYFTDKAPLTTLEQLAAAKETVAKTAEVKRKPRAAKSKTANDETLNEVKPKTRTAKRSSPQGNPSTKSNPKLRT